ncbi:MAG: sulfotransferase [Silicimonas sp.]|jgi:hypothetical protein|nr:sulfotransferase [Silicimonas sp.]
MSILFFCVGATKAGTSWLHRQLSSHAECHFRAIKELHYFNAIDGGTLDRELRKHRNQQQAMLDRFARSGAAPSDEQTLRMLDRGNWIDVLDRGKEDHAAYLGYLQNGAGNARVVGEMTPAYGLLTADRLAGLARLTPDVRFLYLLRDPVDRLWSHIRMIAGRRDESGQVTAVRCARLLDRTLSGEESQIVARSDYAGALDRLAAAIRPARLLIEVFEETVIGPGLDRICDFLGIARIAADPARIHEGQPLAMTDGQRRAAADWLAPQYVAAEAALGRLPASWARGGYR